MKRLFALLLAAVFVWLAMPLDLAAAALNPLPTAQELSAAVTLTGLSDDAPGYHPGMEISQTMNVQQMVGWIVDFAENRLASVMNTFENYDVELHYLQDHDPVNYGLLSEVHKNGIDFFYYRYDEAMDMRDEIIYYRDMLTKYASDVFTMAEKLKEGALTEKEQAVYAYQIRDGWRRLLELMDDASGLATAWRRQCRRMEQMSSGVLETPHGEESFTWLLDAIDALNGGGHASARTMTVSAGAVRVDTDRTVMTRLARLSPIGSALADSDQKMSVMIMDDKSFAIGAMDGTSPMSGVTVTVSAKDVNARTKTTDDSGYISLPVRDYNSDKDGEMKINLTARKDGYRKVDAPGVWVRKGDGFKVPMYKDNGDPYPVMWTFWGNDMTLADYELVLSPFNDSKQDIAIRIGSTKEYTLKMYFTDADGNKTLDVGTGSGKAGETGFTFNGQWLKQAPGDGKLVAEITPQGGSKVTYRAKIKLIAPKLAKPIGDPNFKLLMEPGLQFKLPKSWSKPFSDMTIAINTPLDDVFKVRAYYDLNGNGAITIGTNAFDDRVKAMNEGMWKSQDKKEMDKAVKAAEEKGMMAKAKAQNGGDWAGRSKYNPLKLGKISVTMSWFAYVQGQYRETADNYGQILAKGGAGFTVTVKGEYGLQWPFANATIHVALSGTIFPEIAVVIDTYWPEGQMLPSVKKLDYMKASLNYIIRLEMGLTVTLGLKGVASISATGLGFLEFHFRVTSGVDLDEWLRAVAENRDTEKYHDGGVDLKLYGGAAFKIVLEILWSKTTYTPFGPQWRWKLLPLPVEEAQRDTRKTPVERFLASILSSASAEEADARPQGGMQVDTGNGDLVLEAQEIAYANTDAFGNVMFNMRTSGSGAAETVPMMLYMKNEFRDGGNIRFDRPALIAVPLAGTLMYSPIAKTEEGLDAAGRGSFTDGGYDVIDFDYWVQDVSAVDLSSWDGGGETKLNDVVFIVSILAKDYEQQTRTLEDGTAETRKVPLKTWAYVHCYYLVPSGQGYVLKPVVLTRGGKYLAEMYELQVYHDPGTNPCADPRIYGNIVRTETSVLTYFRIVSTPMNIVNRQYREQACVQVFAGIEETGKTFQYIELMGKTDSFFNGSEYEDFLFIDDWDNSKAYTGSINQVFIGYSATYYSLVHSMDKDTGLYSLGYDNAYDGTRIYAENVASFVHRGLGPKDDSRYMIFFVQQDGEDGCVLKGMLPVSGTRDKKWTEWNYGVSVPAATIRWTTLYGRECVYWAETAGETKDGKAEMFKVRGVWFDSASSTMSEPFTIATLKTPLNSSPAEIILAGNDSGCYILRHEDGRRTAHRFNFQLVLGVRMVGNVLAETLASPGTYDDVVLTLYNNGNVPLSGLDLSVCDQDGSGRAEVFETVHLDVLNPQKNRVTLVKGQGLSDEKQGVTVARQEECSLNGDDTHFWLVRETEYMFRKPTPRVLSDNSSLLKTDLIMPGTFAAFNISLLMPQDWKDTHNIYLQVEKMYTTESTSFSGDANALTARGAAEPAVISVSRNGEVRREGGGLLTSRGGGAEENDLGYASMFKTDLSFDRMRLNTDSNDVEIYSRRWDASDGTPMVTLTVYNKKYIAMENRRDNVLVMEAFLDDETAVPSFRYSFTEEVSNKETWNFDLPLSLLTGGKKASRVRVGISGKDYSENGVFDNTTVIYLDTEELSFLEQPADLSVPAGSGALFHAAAAGGRTPYRYQWQQKLPQGNWQDIPGETGDTLELKAVTGDMNGNRYRLAVRDANDNTVLSREAVLTVRKVPHTGDSTPIGWYLAGIAAAVSILGYLGLKRKREQAE